MILPAASMHIHKDRRKRETKADNEEEKRERKA